MQFEFPGTLDVPDGRYLIRSEAGQRVLVVEAIGAPPPPRRRRRRPKESEQGDEPAALPLSRVTAVRAEEPFDSTKEADSWLDRTIAAEDEIDAAVADGLRLLNRALHAHATASADPLWAELRAENAAAVRIGIGSGKEVASGRFTTAHVVDARAAGGSRRQRQDEDLRPQERLAAVLGGREQLDACETLILRARADLDADRRREAALQLRVALEAMLVELDGALTDPDHARDMGELQERRSQAGDAANAALRSDLPVDDERHVTELVEICERVLRRRRVLRG
ncbi:MAG TPA: hypothetical protein VLK56_01425 [Solirubrobacterales bacterium]|nr:hypothetical protein [Solirubrobacterales bacterium]